MVTELQVVIFTK